MTILVTGATGNVGRHLVEQLLDGGHRVRALTRNPEDAALPAGVEVVGGDLTVAEKLPELFEGVTAAHLITIGDDGGKPLENAKEIVAAAAAAGVHRVTVLWSGMPGPVEAALAESDLEWTLLEPVEFMSNALNWVDSIRADAVVAEAFANEPSTMVHEADIAAVAAHALLEDGHAGMAYSITGPQVLTVPDKVRILGEVLGRTLKFVELSDEAARERMRATGATEEVIDFVVAWHNDPPAPAYTVMPTVETVTGKPPRSFAQWAAEHAARF